MIIAVYRIDSHCEPVGASAYFDYWISEQESDIMAGQVVRFRFGEQSGIAGIGDIIEIEKHHNGEMIRVKGKIAVNLDKLPA